MILDLNTRSLHPGITVLSFKGSIHSGPDCTKLSQEIDKLIAANEIRVILDMSAVTHADSAAIGVIVKSFTKLKQVHGALHIACAQPMIDYCLKLTKLDRILRIFPTVEQAAAAFSTPDATAPPAKQY